MPEPHGAGYRPPFSLIGATFALLFAMVLAGCGAHTGASHEGVLRLPLYGSISTLDPARVSTSSEIYVASLLYSGLMKFGPDLHVIPDLAVSIPTISVNGRTYTFTVRRDARFADGRPCTAADVAYSLNRALSRREGSSLARRYLGGIAGAAAVERGKRAAATGIRVVQRLTIRITLARPDAQFLQKLAFPVAAVVDHRVTSAEVALGMPAGTGAWMLANRGTDGRLTLSPRSHAYGGTLQLQSIVLLPVASEAAALDLYRHNSLDVARVPPGRVASTKDMTDFHISDGLDAYYLEPAQPSERLTGADLDRTAVLQTLEPALTPLAGIVPPAVPDYVSSAPGDSSTHAVTLKVVGSPTGDPVATRLSRAIRASERGPAKRAIPVRLVHVRNSLPDPGVWLGLLWDQSSSRWYRRSLGHAASLTNDPVSRMDLYSRVEDWALQRGLLLPLASGTVAYLVKSSVQSLQVTPLGLMPDNNNWSTVTVG